MNRSGLLNDQQEITKKEHEKLCTDVIPFLNILDKGYRCTSAAWRHGKQNIMQPAFACSDRKFTTSEIALSSAIAADRATNERTVNRSKLSGYLRSGFSLCQDPNLFSDVWLV